MVNKIFDFEKPEDSPGFLLWQTTITWQRLIKKVLDPYNISHSQFVILAITLWFENNKQETSQSLIIQLSKLDKMTVSKSLQKLAVKNYVKRAENKEDTREKLVRLTRKGREMITKLVPLVESIDARFFGTIKKGEQQMLIHILNSLTKSS